MNATIDLLIVGAGPAGMSAAIKACELGLSVLVIDEQPEPGGQIWRGIERVAETPRAKILGKAYIDGKSVVENFRQCGAKILPQTTLWHIEEGPVAYIKSDGETQRITPGAILLATGAQERPIPFKGWTLPGVMTVGAGQILLKSSGQIPSGPLLIAGSGPLALLYAVQLLDAGAEIKGFLDTTPKGRVLSNAISLIAALFSRPLDLIKGLTWLAKLRIKIKYIPYVAKIAAEGHDHLERVTFATRNQKTVTLKAQHLLVHEGIIPAIHPTMALGCDHVWTDAQDSYAPALDTWGATSIPFISAAGDLAGIAGSRAACLRGELAVLGIATKLGRLTDEDAKRMAKGIRRSLSKEISARRFLDQAYRPRPNAFVPEDDALVCRCEEVTAGAIRTLCRNGKGDPNRIKAFSRAGMGSCQGRLCNYTIANILADETGTTPSNIGLYRVRPPFKPLTLDELSKLGPSMVDS